MLTPDLLHVANLVVEMSRLKVEMRGRLWWDRSLLGFRHDVAPDDECGLGGKSHGRPGSRKVDR